ncbi:tRNA adenosine(34) deaminase TadA [Oceanidesulfovibrio marinus]|nr:tRNA adenosine(34) deaminase TadA [Oceanidesulfovibrio marinus]
MTATEEFPFPEYSGLRSWEDVMRLALEQAERAEDEGEVPIGAVVLSAEGRVLGYGRNRPISAQDPTAHAEIEALRAAAAAVGNYRLPGAVLAVTLEPCLMCMGAMIHARVAHLVYGAPDPKTGAAGSCMDAAALPFLNHRMDVTGGVLADECGDLLRRFFKARR